MGATDEIQSHRDVMKPNLIPLPDAPSGRSWGVVSVLDGPDRGRLWELGVLPGIEIRVVRVAPMGCPMEIEIDGSRFALRRETALTILVATAGSL